MIDELVMKKVIDNMEHMVRVMDRDDHIVYMNRSMKDQYGDRIGTKCYEFLDEGKRCDDCICEDCHRSGKAESKDIVLGEKHFRVIASPVVMSEQEKYSIELFHDITSEKQFEEELDKQYRRMKNDVSFAKQIQNHVLPLDGDYGDSIRLDSLYLPSEELGGDLYDFVQVDEDHMLFYIADVSGHGIQSSLLTIFLRQVIRGLKTEAKDPNKILEEMIRNYHDLHLDKEQYFSVLFCVYHRDSHELVFVNAGHNALPILMRMDGTLEEVQISGMPVCSLLTEANHQTVTVSMSAGDRVMLYTDGITEAWNEQKTAYLTPEALHSWLKSQPRQSSKKLISKLAQHVTDYSGGRVTDDIAVLIAEIL